MFSLSTPCFGVTHFGPGVATGNIQNAAVTEASGIVASRMNSNVLWTHNDSLNPNQLFAMTKGGVDLGTYTVTGTSNLDWEDVAVGPGPTNGVQYLYIGDIGNLNNIRGNSITVYRVPEPIVGDTQPAGNYSLPGAVAFNFSFPDGKRDAESMFIDPLTSDIYIISKEVSPTHLYRAAYPQSTSSTTTLQLMTTFAAPSFLTAADISPDGNEIIVRAAGETTARLFVRPPGGSITDAFSTTPITIPLHAETQGEAIGFDSNGWGYFTTSEGAAQPIYYFDRLPHGDFNHTGSADSADYVGWRKGLGTTYTAADYITWRANFEMVAATGASFAAIAVPEPAAPTAWFLLGLGVGKIAIRQRVADSRVEK
jgi:hypothetical protein